jgi:hypothetical protein
MSQVEAPVATAGQEEEMNKWSELEINFLNEWMNRRLLKRWKAYLDTLQPEENS